MSKIGDLTLATSNFQDFSVSGFAQANAATPSGGGYVVSINAANPLSLPVFVNAQITWNYTGVALTSGVNWTASVVRTRDGLVLQSKDGSVTGNGSKTPSTKFDLFDADALPGETYQFSFKQTSSANGGTVSVGSSFISVLFSKK